MRMARSRNEGPRSGACSGACGGAACTVQRRNRTGLPDNLRAGIENLSGVSMDGVRVHRGSSFPSQVQAHATTQGADIHLAPGQDRHLPHEAWHVVQQAQGRVRPTMELNGVRINDNPGLEREADVMGARASQFRMDSSPQQETVQNKSRWNGPQ